MNASWPSGCPVDLAHEVLAAHEVAAVVDLLAQPVEDGAVVAAPRRLVDVEVGVIASASAAE